MTSSVAPVREAVVGFRVPLFTGKVFETRKVLRFPTAVRWMELLELFNAGEAQYRDTVAKILAELPEELDPVDLTVLDELTFAEVVHDVLYRFFAHRRTPADLSTMKATSPASEPPSL